MPSRIFLVSSSPTSHCILANGGNNPSTINPPPPSPTHPVAFARAHARYNLQRELEASRDDMSQLGVQVKAQNGTIRYFQLLNRDLVSRLRAYEPDYMPPVGWQ